MYIYESSHWPQFIWDKEQVYPLLAKINQAAGFLAGRLHDIGLDSQLKVMADTFTSDIVESYAIEGISLDTDQVRSSVARKIGIDIPNQTEPSHYIDGIVTMTMDAITNYDAPLTHERLFGWHRALFPNNRSGMIEIQARAYRTTQMKVVSGMFGREHVHYQAPQPEEVYAMMQTFLDWFNATENPTYIKSAIAHLYFISIHPFDDGNGRIARALSDMALSQSDHSAIRYFSISNQINNDKKHYYKVLEQTQHGDGDITEWIVWYLNSMKCAIESSNQQLSMVLRKALFWQKNATTTISERQKQILNYYLDGYEGKLTIKNYAKIAHVSTDTASRDIKDLIQKGILEALPNSIRNVEYKII